MAKTASPESRDRSRINTLDFFLMSVGSALAAYSAGMSINQPEIGWFFVRLIALGTVFSFFIRRFLSETIVIKGDGLLYVVVGLVTVTQTISLNALLPGDPFPRQLLAASWLGWMLALGSFITWRDGTLLFQAVPAVALFGLVGCYDTFRDVTFAFFGYLLCLSTLFARAHGRDMLRLVVASGYVTRADQRSRGKTIEVRQDQALYERLRIGPWRWVAGPEWALLSAMTVVGLSVLGAPVIQGTVQTVAAGVRVPVDVQVRPTPNQAPGAATTLNNVRVGNGPNTGLTDQPLYEYTSEGGNGYLRTGTYSTYTGEGWRREEQSDGNPLQYIIDQVSYRFSVRKLVPTVTIPAPAETYRWKDSFQIRRNNDGTFASETPGQLGEIEGEAVAPRTLAEFRRSLAKEYAGSNWLDTSSIHPEIFRFTLNAIKGAKSDREKAERIKSAITARVKYNLKARAVPQGADPARFFLFESREGYCDLFATAMTVAARAAGLPARYVQGYLPNPQNIDGAGRQMVLSKDYHAWCEILFEDVGWVVYDATEGAESVPGGERGGATSTLPLWEQPWFRNAVNTALVAFAVLAFGVLILIRYRAMSAVRRKSELEKLTLEYVRLLEKTIGQRRRASQTLREFVALGAAKLGPERANAEGLAVQLTDWLYGPAEPTMDEVKLLRQQMLSLRQRMRQNRA
ncbi:MAG: transglutaminase domain-containing protein [Fimbriimonadaceae bacterium]|nr:transglutaminase domain-containing protein [Fimbriimonadaceae bacterium]